MAPPPSHRYFNLLGHDPPRPHLHLRPKSLIQPVRIVVSSIHDKMQRLVSFHASPPSATPLRDRLSDAVKGKSGKEKISPEFKRALQLLNLTEPQAFEDFFLGKPSFLVPWAEFRDSFFLLQPPEKRASEPGKITGMDILWFYTHFDEGLCRYDSRGDINSPDYTDNVSQNDYGRQIDKSGWGAEEWEKLMYVWMLQLFEVGKISNKTGIRYFKLRNVCTAWKEVFVPIVDAVRDSYGINGKQHYGRLALYIESQRPSQLGVLQKNVPTPTTSTPLRILSIPKQRDKEALPQAKPDAKKPDEFEEAQQELRQVFPKYGQLIERPKNRAGLLDWIALKKKNLQQKNPVGRKISGRESPMWGCQGIGSVASGIDSPRRSRSLMSFSSGRRSPSSPRSKVPRTPTRKNKMQDKLEKYVPYGMYGRVPKSPKPSTAGPKSPSHGITRPFELPRTPPEPRQYPETITERDTDSLNESFEESSFNLSPLPSFRPSFERQASDGVYNSIRESNPFVEEKPKTLSTMLNNGEYDDSDIEEHLPMNQLSAIPPPLALRGPEASNEELPPAGKGEDDGPRYPSYEGTGYEQDITPNFIADKMHATLEHDGYQRDRTVPGPSRIPAPIQPVPYGGNLRTASNQSRFPQPGPPQHVPWPGRDSPSPPPKGAPRPGDDSPPPVPPKNPTRYNSKSDIAGAARSEQLHNEEPLRPLGPRIVSKENIRAHLGGLSREASEEDLRKVHERERTARAMTASPPTTLRTYNSHMFPRKGTPVGAWMDKNRYGPGGEYEMKVLKEDEEQKE
ncbi:hypothetical protein BU26DRAFT_594610 [Trematosphaeria pertusa]|uniref:Uncharacterized protein n=1 Tax=Trematosphaeria pertusa TaxID=390896 RepID=A0A6A6IFA3_9PLEO|nr:uncharacterized protein BU26DRAFT_594610 [Trematosphaeria pertusa]KAF2248877.1 hypothetical protein BU26DRAFT_594610 [Trematosphaeria pertusa]